MSTVDTDNHAVANSIKTKCFKAMSLRSFISSALLALIMLMVISAAYMWSHRGMVLTKLLQNNLETRGLSLDMSIEEFSSKQLILNDVFIRSNNAAIFSTKTLRADYNWRDMFRGNVERIVIDRAHIDVEVDSTGKIINDWFPSSNDAGPALVFPPKGLLLKDSHIKARTPYGTLEATGDINLIDQETLHAEMAIAQSDLNLGGVSMRGGGTVSINIKPGRNDLSAQLNFAHITHPDISMHNAQISGNLILDLIENESHITGPLSIAFSEIKGDIFSSKSGHIQWDGKTIFTPDTTTLMPVKGDWDIKLNEATYSDEVARLDLVNRFMSYETLSNVPIVQPFSSTLRNNILDFFSDTYVDASGNFSNDGGEVKVNLKRPLKLLRGENYAHFIPHLAKPIYHYSPKEKQFYLQSDVEISHALPFNLQDLHLYASSNNGLTIDQLDRVKTTFTIPSAWHVVNGPTSAKLFPLSAPISYENTGNERIIKTQGHLKYDGPLPGGSAKNLQTHGALSLNIDDKNTVASLVQSQGRPITFESFKTANSDWHLGPTILGAPSQNFKFVKGPKQSHLSAGFGGIDTVFVNFKTQQRIPSELSDVSLKSILENDEQNWSLKISSSTGTPENFTEDHLDFEANDITLTTRMAQGEISNIDLASPQINVTTSTFEAVNMPLHLTGTLDDMLIEYGHVIQPAILTLKDSPLPSFPFYGSMAYKANAFEGQAILKIPKSNDSTANINYAYNNGQGHAHITLPLVEFKRGKLQPQIFIPSLRGKIADVNGAANADLNIIFENGSIAQSSGLLTLTDMSFGTLPGPFSGVNTQIKLQSVLPLQTEGKQILTVGKFDPGLPLNSGRVEYELRPEGVKIYSAAWPIGGGTISLAPTLWNYAAPKNTVSVNIDDVSIGAFVNTESLSATGKAQGTFPVTVKGVNVYVSGGRVNVKDGGTIRYNAGISQTSPEALSPNEISKNPSELAFKALQNFQYETLEATLDGPLDGEIGVSMEFMGKNPDILGGTPFDFNVNIAGELFNLARNIKMGNDMDAVQQLIQNQNNPVPQER